MINKSEVLKLVQQCLSLYNNKLSTTYATKTYVTNTVNNELINDCVPDSEFDDFVNSFYNIKK